MYVQTTACFPLTYAERRRAARRQPARETVCRLVSHDGEVLGTGLVWNISTTGLSLLFHASLPRGTDVEAELISPMAQRPLRVGLRVIHHTPIQTGDYALGGQFSRPLTEDELRPFVA